MIRTVEYLDDKLVIHFSQGRQRRGHIIFYEDVAFLERRQPHENHGYKKEYIHIAGHRFADSQPRIIMMSFEYIVDIGDNVNNGGIITPRIVRSGPFLNVRE